MRQIIIAIGTLKLGDFELPLRIFGYGLMLVLGFLTAILLARWRARRSGEDPETISQCAVLALIGGVIGARVAFVVKEWETYRDAGLAEIFNITSGGLIYFGGLLGGTAVVLAYLLFQRLPMRRFLDIVAPSLMVSLAFGRMGCLLNGCCWGGPCQAHWALATRFPMISKPLVKIGAPCPYVDGQSLSPPYAEQYWSGQVTPDDQLLNAFSSVWSGESHHRAAVERKSVLPVEQLHRRLDSDQLATMGSSEANARRAFVAQAGDDGRLDREEWDRARQAGDGFLRGSEAWDEAVCFGPAGVEGRGAVAALSFEEAWAYLQARRQRLLARFDTDGDGQLTGPQRDRANEYLQADLYERLAAERTNPLRPAQALGIANGLFLAALLWAFYRHRRREGRVFALMLILYPITRYLLESIRSVEALGVLRGGWTHNQISSMVLVLAGAALWWWTGARPASAGPALVERLANR